MKSATTLFIASISLAMLVSAGCRHRDATVSVEHADRGTTLARTAGSADAGWTTYGEPIMAEMPALDIAAVLADPTAYAGRDVELRGTIAEVCARKGCWLRIADPAGGEETIFVKFTCPIDADERLIPADAAGQRVIVQGQVVVEEMSQEQARHYAEDAGKSAEEVAAITGPQKTIRVMSPAARLAA